jgi:misacylated tRNA(Ala) deacylase
VTLGHLDQHPGLNPAPFIAKIDSVTGTELILDQTSFYPVGGGQPADRGHIIYDDVKSDVFDIRGKDPVIHTIGDESDHLHAGQTVRCIIDHEWRNQLCKMHTAQHIISAQANEEWGAITVGNQIGFDRTRIDLQFTNRELFDRDHLQELVNDSIEKNMIVSMDFRPSSELIDDPLVRINMERMPPDIDIWRTISIGNLDVCPCAGTHVSETSQIPLIEITKVKSKGSGKLRVEYILNN